MKKIRETNEIIEERIQMEIVVDAYDSEERAMGWYYYLDDKITFPFVGECTVADKRSPLTKGEQAMVIKMSGEDYCEHDMYVDISWSDKTLAIPLSNIKPLNCDNDTDEAVGDWHYWKMQGYEF